MVFFSYWFRTEHKQCSLRLDSSTLWFTPQKYNSSWRNHYIGEKKLCNTIVINYCFALDFIGYISIPHQTPWQIIFKAIIQRKRQRTKKLWNNHFWNWDTVLLRCSLGIPWTWKYKRTRSDMFLQTWNYLRWQQIEVFENNWESS